jgi:tetratricopeptide (TPR) repeat protein
MKKILLLLCISSFGYGQMTAIRYAKRGDLNSSNRNYKEAIQDYTKAIELDPDNDSYCSSRGWSKYSLKDGEGVIIDLTKAIELNPKDSESYRGRGLAKIMLFKKDSGCLDLSRAGELGNDDAYDLIKQFCN